MTKIFALDVYGTLIDTHGLLSQLTAMIGDKAVAFSTQWRTKQLEYSFRRATMSNTPYQDFSHCTKAALVYTNALFKTQLDNTQQQTLLDGYLRLPAYEDAKAALSLLVNRGHECWAFSNGKHNDITSLMHHAQLHADLHGIFSVEPLQTYKPDPLVYQTFAQQHQQPCVLVSSNPFDIIGAKACNWETVWVQRHPNNIFDPWEFQPDHTVSKLTDIAALYEYAANAANVSR